MGKILMISNSPERGAWQSSSQVVGTLKGSYHLTPSQPRNCRFFFIFEHTWSALVLRNQLCEVLTIGDFLLQWCVQFVCLLSIAFAVF